MKRNIHDEMCNRWASLLPMLGVSAKYLDGKHGPCPICEEGRDRFRFDNKSGKRTWICSKCVSVTGIDLVMRVHAIEFGEAVKRVRALLPETVVAASRNDNVHNLTYRGQSLWQRAAPLTGLDPASRFLSKRGLDLDVWPTQLRYLPQATHWSADKVRTRHPAMIAQFVGPNPTDKTYHLTYLTETGDKAQVDKVRKMYPGPIPKGGAVRLAASGPVLGIAEGIETALSASKLFDVPVWASLNAGSLMKFEPPETVAKVMVFGDNDSSMTGQHAAYALAYRLKSGGWDVEVHLPDSLDMDWNDLVDDDDLDTMTGGPQ